LDRRAVLTLLGGLAAICVVAVISVTLLGGDGTYRRYGGGPKDCLTILEDRTSCSRSAAWYRITKEKPTSDGCSRGRRKSDDGDKCLEPLNPVEVDIDLSR
jgi:hypothetical protein